MTGMRLRGARSSAARPPARSRRMTKICQGIGLRFNDGVFGDSVTVVPSMPFL
jgi:hypothetical protein